MLLFVRAQARPVTADDVAARFDVHRSVARGRLDRLVEAGLLEVGFERRTGRTGPGAGRPAKVYGVRPETAALEFPVRHYERLLAHLVAALPADEREEALAKAGAEFARDLAGDATDGAAEDIGAAAERACEALGRMGFQAAVADVSEGRVTITTATCPLRPLVVTSAEAAAIDRAMWAGLVRAHLREQGNCYIRCETCDCLDADASCRVVLERETAEPSAGQRR